MANSPAEEEVEVQDNARENKLRELFKLKKGQGRLGADAFDEDQNPIELKTTTSNSVGTARDVSFEMINGWRKRSWIMAKGRNYVSGFVFEEIYFLSPSMIEGALKRIEDHIRPDIELKNKVVNIVNNQTPRHFSSDEIERIDYLMSRGSTLNNPKIPWHYIVANGILITEKFPETLHTLIQKHVNEKK